MDDFRFNLGRDPIKFLSNSRNYALGWSTGTVAAVVMIIIGSLAAYRWLTL